MTREQLIEAGVPEDKVDGILKLHKDAIDGNYIPKATFEAEREKVKTLKADIDTRNTQITELKKFKGTSEELETKLGELEEENKLAKQNYEAELTKLMNNNALVSELTGKVIDPDDVIPRLDLEKIKFNEGKVESGLKEQLDELAETKPHYFPKEGDNASKNTAPGWIFGKKPKEGADGGSEGNKAADFGKQLAQLKTSGNEVANKAQEHYFK